MSEAMGMEVEYINPSVKEFKEHMLASGVDEAFINVVVGIHFPTKLMMAKGIKYDFEKAAGRKPTKMKQYVEDYKENWI
ncbi:hypothetical protein [Bacillus sp. ISL-39]|uniref:hypothetical protein n=1 Tax=Bacillus sp. ISL-39 TaxID=2819124 RepID=UPI001BE80E00|nr:hypothetical protein [Bacillus sp. ISL-39]MBT2639826.1 hypothetical protein [Bacillus sp. ISL-39]